MCEAVETSPAAGLPGTEPEVDRKVELPELKARDPAGSRKMHTRLIPEELLVSLTSTVHPGTALGAAHHKHSTGCGVRRPDAVWYHPLGRKKYKYFLDQPTSLTGAGRDISFLCDAMATQRKRTPLPPLADKSGDAHTQAGCLSILDSFKDVSLSESLIPEEYHIVKNKGLQGLEFYEDKFTVQLQDEDQRLRVFPSLRPSGRLEAVQLMRTMDEMLEKTGMEQQCEEMTDISQMQGLLELVRVEQNIYNVVFHELIRQVSVGCAERGQLLAKLRSRYQSLLERIPRRLKALHTEVLAQRALDRRLTEEILRFRTSIQQLNVELSRIRDHDALVSQQAERARQQLAEALDQAHNNSDLVHDYHELYEMHRLRLEAEQVRLTDERDHWSRVTFSLALKMISLKKLKLVSRLHVSEQSWSKTAQHCTIFLTSQDTEDRNVITQLTDQWKDQLTAFMSRLRETEHAQCEQIHGVQQGIAKWLAFCTMQNMSPDPKYGKVSEEEIHADLIQWSNTLTQQCERYGGEELLNFHQALDELGRLQESWVDLGLQLFRRHPAPDGAPPGGQEAMRDLGRMVSELHKQLDTRVNGESGIHKQMMSMVRAMGSWSLKLKSAVDRPDRMPVSDWLKLEKMLGSWQSLAEEALQNVASMQTESDKAKNKVHVNLEVEDVFQTMLEFTVSQSTFFNCENQRLREEVGSIHMALTRWMLDLLLLMLPDQDQGQDQDQDHHSLTNVSVDKLGEDAKTLAQKLDYFSRSITSSCRLVLEEKIQKTRADHDMYEFNKLQRDCSDWVETSGILLSDVKSSAVELSVTQPGPTSNSDAPVSADSIESLGETPDHDSSVMKLIGYDGNITERMLGESSVLLDGTEVLVVSPATDDAQKAFDALATLGRLQRDLQVSEVRVQSAEQRALKAEEALQAALEKIQDLERQLQGRSSLEPKAVQKPPSPPAPTDTAPPKKTTPDAKPTSSIRKTKKR
ncbi:axonemal dynein light chain domain-containing protein 1 [Diretmus argenteus]